MFDFIFKRATKRVASTQPLAAQGPSAPLQAARDTAHDLARNAARAHAENIAHDEAASVTFLLTCEFADARLIAAQSIQSEEALQRVVKALRNSDRRVARLMQSRLDAVQAQQAVAGLAAQCVADATSMTTQPLLTAQKVGEIDRRWTALVNPPQALQDAFATARNTLGSRLVEQAEMQRKLIDALASLRTLSEDAMQLPIEALQADVERHEADIAWCDASVEAVNLPKNLLTQCRTAVLTAREALHALHQREAQSAALVTLLQRWEAAPPDALNQNTLRRDWQVALQSVDVAPDLQARFAALLALVALNQPVKTAAAPAATVAAVTSPGESAQAFITALQALDEALVQGSLQHAQEADRLLRSMNGAAQPNAAQAARLSRLRAQLSQLQSWARWGGTISREELHKGAIALPEQGLTLVELAKKIGNLRQQWKALDATSGPASKELWQGFDAACTTAYAPVAEHHRVLDEARRANSEAAQRQIAAVEQAADQLAAQEQPDWKATAQLCQRAQQEWQRIGPTERRDKQALDRRFKAALQRLLQPLDGIQKAEQTLREQLISSAEQLRARDPGTLDALRVLQQQWQARSHAVPLDRRIEQALWLRFRAACDAVFAQRKESAAAEDQQRQHHLHAREALCLALEQSSTQSIDGLTTLLRDSAASWGACGPVPRASQEAIEKRYRQAVGVIKKHLDDLQRASANAHQQGVRQKLQLCLRLEATLAQPPELAAEQIAQLAIVWKESTSITTRFDAPLSHRFEQGLQAYHAGDRTYVQLMCANQIILHHELLRLEIVFSLDSPPHLARERLKLQVDGLQSALRHGGAAGANPEADALAFLCALPVAVDAETSTRLERILAHLLG